MELKPEVMMKKVFCLFLVGVTILSVGCPVRSIFPLFSKQENIFNPSLVGKWLIVGKEYLTRLRLPEQQTAIGSNSP